MEEIFAKYKFDSDQKDAASSVYGYKPDNKGMLEVYGELYGVISLAVEVEFDVTRITGLLLDELQEGYFQEGKLTSDLKDFEGSLRRMRKRLEAIIEREPELAGSGLDLEAAFVVIKKDMIYAAVIGESSIFVARGDEINEISGALADPDQDKFMRTGSLRLQADDRLLLATDVVAGGNKEEVIVDSLVDFHLRTIDIRRGAALLIGYGIDPVLAEEPVEEEVELIKVEPEPEPEYEEEETEEAPTIMLGQQREPTPVRQPRYEEVEESEYEEDYDHEAKSVEPGESPLADLKEKALGIVAILREKVADFDFVGVQNQVKTKVQGYAQKLTRPASHAEDREEHEHIQQHHHEPIDRLHRKTGVAAILDKVKSLALNVKGDKTRYIIAGVVILLIVVGYGFYQENQRIQRQQKLDALASELTEIDNSVEALVTDASAVSNDAVGEKQELVKTAEELVTKLDELGANPVVDEDLRGRINKVKDKINPAVDEALRVSGFSQVQLIADLGAKFQDSNPVGMALAGGKLYVIDQKRNSLYEMPSNNENVDVAVATSSLKSPYLIDTDADANLVIVDSTADSIVARYDTDSNNVTRVDGLSSDKMGKLQSIDIWTNNRAMYALSAAKQSIVRQDDVSGAFSLPDFNVPWRKDPQFTDAKELAVDGSIYVLVKGKGVQKYLSQQPSTLRITGIMPEDKQIVANATQMFVTTRRVFVADSASKSIISLVKDLRDGTKLIFEGKYVYRGTDQAFSDIRDIVVNEQNQKIFVLEGNRVVRLSYSSF